MNILVALDNEEIYKRINNKFVKDKVYKYDIDSKENVIEFLSQNDTEFILVTRDSLNGNIDNKMYIKQIKLANPKTNIVYLVNRLTKEYKEFLFANEVFNIIEGEEIDINEVLTSITEDKKVVYKNNEVIKEETQNYIIDNNVITKKIIAIYGTSGSGKSVVSSIIAKKLAKDFKIKVALLDMDIQSPSIDIINNIDEKDALFSKIVESVDNSEDVNSIISKYMIKDCDNKNLWYITNNCSLFDCQNKLSSKYYDKLYSSVHKKCDYTLIDLPSSPFLDVVPYTLNIADKILFIINANYMSIRQAIKYINLITRFWDNDTGKIHLIINKRQKDFLDKKQIESLLNGYKIVCTLDYYKEVEAYINGGSINLNIDIDMNMLYKSLGLKSDCNRYNLLKKIYTIGKKYDN